MTGLCVDIGGTKYTVAVFENERILRQVSSPTEREGGREWMLQALGAQIAELRRAFRFERCGVGFGGPVNFRAQQVALSTHVGGWTDFDLPGWLRQECGVPVIMDRWLKVEHARYVGRMHWLGFNTSRITSVRGGLQ